MRAFLPIFFLCFFSFLSCCYEDRISIDPSARDWINYSSGDKIPFTDGAGFDSIHVINFSETIFQAAKECGKSYENVTYSLSFNDSTDVFNISIFESAIEFTSSYSHARFDTNKNLIRSSFTDSCLFKKSYYLMGVQYSDVIILKSNSTTSFNFSKIYFAKKEGLIGFQDAENKLWTKK